MLFGGEKVVGMVRRRFGAFLVIEKFCCGSPPNPKKAKGNSRLLIGKQRINIQASNGFHIDITFSNFLFDTLTKAW